MKRILLSVTVLAAVCLLGLAGCQKEPPEPAHQHTFGDWKLQQSASCQKEGRQTRTCTTCGDTEEAAISKTPHSLNAYKICRECGYVSFDPNADLVELGNTVAPWYDAGAPANCAWDLIVWEGKLYRTAGDYDKNPGIVVLWAYDIANQQWYKSAEIPEEALHRLVEIDGKLMTPGVDPRGGWELGNYYVLGKTWEQVRNLPNGIHNFDMIEFEGKIFAGLGVEGGKHPCVMSTDKGQTFDFVYLYKNGEKVDTTGMTYIRIYEYWIFRGELYALVTLDSDTSFYRFDGEKWIWMSSAAGFITSNRANYNYFNAKLELDDTCFIVSNRLLAVKDFADSTQTQLIEMPGGEYVSDAMLKDGILYTLCYKQTDEQTYEIVIYKSATGQAGSFTQVVRFDYAVPACSFTLEGDYFYLGMGSKRLTHKSNGMILRVKNP